MDRKPDLGPSSWARLVRRYRPSRVIGNTRFQPDLFEGPVVLIDKEEVGQGVVGHEKIHPAVVVHIGHYDSKGLSRRPCDSGTLTDVGKCTVAIVVEEAAWPRCKNTGNAVVFAAKLVVSTAEVFVVFHKTRNKEVQFPVVVVI